MDWFRASSVPGKAGAPAAPGAPFTAPPLWGPPWLGPIQHRTQLDLQWLLVCAAMLGAALVFFGWRAMLAVCTAALSGLVSFVLVRVVLRIFWPTRPRDSSLHALVLGLLLGLSLPLVRSPSAAVTAGLTLSLSAGLLLGMLANFIGRSHRLRISPVPLVVLLAWTLPLLLPPWRADTMHLDGYDTMPTVLTPSHAVLGDAYDHPQAPSSGAWWSQNPSPDQAMNRRDPYRLLLAGQREFLRQPNHMVNMLSSGQLPRLGEVIIGAVPGPVGATSPALLILLGLYLMYRRQSTWFVPLVALAAALLTLLVMPVRMDAGWSLVLPHLVQMGAARSTAYLSYLVLASPLALVVMILAPMTAPTSNQGRLVYALVLGAVMVVVVWLVPAPPAAMLSLVVAGLLSRPLDGLHSSPFASA